MLAALAVCVDEDIPAGRSRAELLPAGRHLSAKPLEIHARFTAFGKHLLVLFLHVVLDVFGEHVTLAP